MLNNNERELISQIACDDETGSHLLGKRSEEYWAMRDEIFVARQTMMPTQRFVDILEYYRQCSDFAYYQSLPPDKRAF